MNKVILLIMCFCLISYPVFADDAPADNSNWGVQPAYQDADDSSPSQDAWDRERDEIIDRKYGSEDSPAFLNRENINPNEADYGYGSTDGYE